MDTTSYILLIALIVGVIYIILQKREAQNAEAFFWRTHAEPLSYIMDDPFDTTAAERAEYALSMLKKHGNPYLTENDVWLEVYSASHENPTRDFGAWRELVLQSEIRKREAWRAQKVKWNPSAAQSIFTGQKQTAA